MCVKAKRVNLHTIGIDGLGHSATPPPRSSMLEHRLLTDTRPRKPTETDRHRTVATLSVSGSEVTQQYNTQGSRNGLRSITVPLIVLGVSQISHVHT